MSTSARMIIGVGIEKFWYEGKEKKMNNQSDSKVGVDGRKARGHRLKEGWGFINGQLSHGLTLALEGKRTHIDLATNQPEVWGGGK